MRFLEVAETLLKFWMYVEQSVGNLKDQKMIRGGRLRVERPVGETVPLEKILLNMVKFLGCCLA